MDIVKAFSESKLEIIVDLIQVIGIENTIKLVEQCGGTQMHIPMANRVFKSERDALIYADFKTGYTFRALSIKYNLAAATIREIVNVERKHSHDISSKETSIMESKMEVISDLRQVIGIKSTIDLVEVLGNSQIYIPQMNTVIRKEREQSIYKDFDSGASYKEIAKKYSVSEMSVRALIKKRKKRE